MWGLFKDHALVDESSYVYGFFIGSLRDSFFTHVAIYNLNEVLSGGFDFKKVPFESFLEGLRFQKRFLRRHPFEFDAAMLRCVDLVLTSCHSWQEFLSIPADSLNGVDFWFFSHSFCHISYVFLLPYAVVTDDEHFLNGFAFLKRISNFENEFYDYLPFDFSSLEIRQFSENQVDQGGSLIPSKP